MKLDTQAGWTSEPFLGRVKESGLHTEATRGH